MRSPIRSRAVLLLLAAFALTLFTAAPAHAAFTMTTTVSDKRVVIDWPDVTTTAGDFYDVYRNGTWLKYLDLPTSAYTDTAVNNGTTYTYVVRVYRRNADGTITKVDESAPASATPQGVGFNCFSVTTLAAGARPPACWRPYGDNTPFNRMISASATLHPNSANIVSYMTQGNTRAPAKMVANNGGYDYNHANYFAKSTDPLYTINCREPWGTCEPQGKQYRIPAQAKPAGYLLSGTGPDKHISVVQPDGVTTLDLWQSDTPSGTGGTLSASWGGISELNGTGGGSNATAAMWGGFAGVIRAEEMQAGRINHALFAVVPCTNGFVFPAEKGAATCTGNTNAPPNGARIQLDMTQAEIDALTVPTWKKVILRALREYGAIVGDTGGGNIMFGLQFESGMVDRAFGRTEGMEAYGAAQGVPTWLNPDTGRTERIFDLAPGVSWSRMRVVGTCVSQGTC